MAAAAIPLPAAGHSLDLLSDSNATCVKEREEQAAGRGWLEWGVGPTPLPGGLRASFLSPEIRVQFVAMHALPCILPGPSAVSRPLGAKLADQELLVPLHSLAAWPPGYHVATRPWKPGDSIGGDLDTIRVWGDKKDSPLTHHLSLAADSVSLAHTSEPSICGFWAKISGYNNQETRASQTGTSCPACQWEDRCRPAWGQEAQRVSSLSPGAGLEWPGSWPAFPRRYLDPQELLGCVGPRVKTRTQEGHTDIEPGLQ